MSSSDLPPNLQVYITTPLQPLSTTQNPPLMSGVSPTAQRSSHSSRPPVLPVQTYIMRNNSTFYDRGENTIYAPPADPTNPPSTNFFSACTALFHARITRDGSILGYMLRDAETDKPLLKVHFHGNTSNPLSRAFKAFARSAVPKWDVENFGLFSDLSNGTNLGLIQEVFPDNRVFFPSLAMGGMPRLEMQAAASLGVKYYLAVTGVSEPVGEVNSDVMGRFAPRSETYTMVLRRCTREEAVLWLCLVVATDMKRRKSQNTQFGRTFLPIYA